MSLPAHVYAVKDRHGKTRYRFRKRGLPSRYVRGTPDSPEFNASYADCFDPNYTPAPRRVAGQRRRSWRVDLRGFRGKSVVYFIGSGRGVVKIGTTINLAARLKKLQTGHPARLRVLTYVEGDAALEAHYHSLFADHRRHGEWFAGKAIWDEIRRLRSLYVVQPQLKVGQIAVRKAG